MESVWRHTRDDRILSTIHILNYYPHSEWKTRFWIVVSCVEAGNELFRMMTLCAMANVEVELISAHRRSPR